MRNSIIAVTFILAVFSSSAIAEDSKVTRINQHPDGHIFVQFDKSSDCSCEFPVRMAFHKDDDEKFCQHRLLL